MKKKKLRIGKLVITDLKRFIISMSIFILIIVFICILISKITLNSDLKNKSVSEINPQKNYSKILEIYNKDGMKEKFIKDYNEVQNAVGMYIMNNSTIQNDSFSNIILQLNSEFRKDKWDENIINKPSDWNGTWSVDENGIVKFKFSSSKIEPKYIDDEEIAKKVIKN